MFNPYFFHPKYFWYNPKKISKYKGVDILVFWVMWYPCSFWSIFKDFLNFTLIQIPILDARAVWDDKSKLDQNELFEIFVTQIVNINLSGSKYLLSVSISKLLKNFGIFSVHNFRCACHQNLIQEKCILKLILQWLLPYFTILVRVRHKFCLI